MATATATETVVGSHLLKVDSYSKTTAALTVGESIQSDRFQVGGHSWFIECYPRGEHEDGADWVSVFLCLDLDRHCSNNNIKEEDEVKASYKLTLLNRAWKTFLLPDVSRQSRQTFSSKLGSRSTAQFVHRKELESYLVLQADDCLRIRCDVTVISDRDPAGSSPNNGAITVPAPRASTSLGDLLLASEVGRDVTFVVGDEQFTAHSCVLAARSSTAFMEELLLGSSGTAGKEMSGVGYNHHVRFDGIEPRVFKALLHFIYTDSVPDEVLAADDDAGKLSITCCLLRAADHFGMERLKMICSDMLLSSHIVDFTAGIILKLAHRHGCLELKQACIKFLRDLLDSVDQEETN